MREKSSSEPRESPDDLFRANCLTAVDVFAGGGGLSVGLCNAGFNVVAAVESEKNAVRTYRANHPGTKVYKDDVRDVAGDELKSWSPTGRINLLAGCPPCQGFTSLTAKYRRSDMRNALIREMHRLTEEVRPDAVMLENVPRLAMDGYGGPLYEEFLDGLEELGYYVPEASRQVLQMADYGVPQNRRRLVVLAGRGFAIELPAPTHSRDGLNGLPKWKTLRHAIPENLGSPVGLKASRKHGGPRACNWHVVRDITERNRKRLASASPGGDRRDIPTELRPACHKDDDYDGFTNVYGRMAWDETPVTITTGCATPSRGRFGHPEEVRTISIREAALIQTFPPDYVIDTPYVKYATKIVGNALPCHFARLVSEQCHEAILQNVEDPHGPLPDGA